MSRFWASLLLSLILIVCGGCAAHKVHTSSVDKMSSKSLAYPGQAIVGYTLTNGTYVKLIGRVVEQGPDSLAFYRTKRDTGWASKDVLVTTLARKDVATIDCGMTSDDHGSIATIVIATLIFVAIAVAVALSTKESCPFIYSYDGDHYVFDGEPYGGATTRGLERTDTSELEHLAEAGGAYRLRLTNEVDETQHTNSLDLLVVDHVPGTAVVMDASCAPHAFRSIEGLTSASDETGKDLMVWLRETDPVSWYPDLRTIPEGVPLADTRSHITLEFERPPGQDRVWLLTNAATGQWGSHMIRTMLRMRGTSVQEFYRAIDGSEVARKMLADWNDREELFHLAIQVEQADGWVRQGFMPGGGPFVSESRAIPLDLSRVDGGTVRIRINPPIGFWSLNSFKLAWDEEEARVVELHPRSVVDEKGNDVSAPLAAVDDAYLDFPTTSDRADLVFDAPALSPGLERTIFAKTRGWYELHLHDPGPPDAAGLERLANEPGYIVRRAMEEFADYRRTGVLAGSASASGPGSTIK